MTILAWSLVKRKLDRTAYGDIPEIDAQKTQAREYKKTHLKSRTGILERHHAIGRILILSEESHGLRGTPVENVSSKEALRQFHLTFLPI